MWILPLIAMLATASEAPPASVLTVEEVIRAALARAPETVQAGSDVLAATGERQEVATLLNNPEVQVGVGALGSRVQGTLNQPFSLAGEGWHARRAAVAGIDEADANAARAGLIVAVREAEAAHAAPPGILHCLRSQHDGPACAWTGVASGRPASDHSLPLTTWSRSRILST